MRHLVERLVIAYAPLAQYRALVEGWPPPRPGASVPRRARGQGISLASKRLRFHPFHQEACP